MPTTLRQIVRAYLDYCGSRTNGGESPEALLADDRAQLARLCREAGAAAGPALAELRYMLDADEELGLSGGDVSLLDSALVNAVHALQMAERARFAREQKVQHELAHETDGPVTGFVLIARAARLAAKGEVDPSEVANALHGLLRERGLLNDDE